MIETRENFETKVKLNRKEGNPIASCPKTVGTTLRKRSLPLSIYIYIYTSPAKGCVRRSDCARSGGTVISCPCNRSSRVSYRSLIASPVGKLKKTILLDYHRR